MTIKFKLLGGGIAISVFLSAVIALTLFTFGSLGDGFVEIVAKSETGVANSSSTQTSITRAGEDLSQISGGMQAVAHEINRTNQSVKVLERKIKQLSGTLNELSETVEEVTDELPDGLARDNLEDVADAVGDIEEVMRREALVALSATVTKMGEFTAEIGKQVEGINRLTHELEEGKALSSEVVSANRSIQELSRNFATEITISRNVIGAVLLAVVVTMLISVFVLTRAISLPLNRSIDIARGIATGDLNQKVDIKGKDEFGQLGASMSVMIKNLKMDMEDTRQKAAATGRIKVALDNVSANVMVADANHNIIYMNKTLAAMFQELQEDLRKDLPKFDASKLIGCNIDVFHKDPSHQRRLLEGLTKRFQSTFTVGGRTLRVIANPVVDSEGERLGTAVEWADRTQELVVEQEVDHIVDAARGGDLTQRISVNGKRGFFEKLAIGINELVDVSERVINDTLRVLGALAQGELNERIDTEYDGAYGQLKHDANTTVKKLTEVIGNIKGTADVVHTGAGELSQGNSSLSQRTEEQAASLEQTASSMEQMTSTVKQNAGNARQANQLATEAKDQAEKGGEVVGKAVGAMKQISASSGKISDIIGVIDEIAFQTNLLALNAAVEAARAGEQGRGFAVVAGEVRNLAQRSATAAKEIKGLIQDSGEKVDEGSRLVDESGQTLETIVSAVKKVSDIVAEIASASQEQSTGIDQVNKAVMQMDEMTQQNAALVEQSTAASEAMSEQAQNLNDMIAFFRVGEKEESDSG
ncbi:MAG: HAMP domain-containing protein [Gammaproteobacteria bacterium]|nr:HAMP domain-containing protein [Gammaproteobacteria bacterium]